ncbi:MAG: flagellar protein FlaG [bacterium]|nr:flagellar protein FlaG [bacterium]
MATMGIETEGIVVQTSLAEPVRNPVRRDDADKSLSPMELRHKEAQTPSSAESSKTALHEAAEAFSGALGLLNRGLRFEVDDETNAVIVHVIDRETQEVIRQIPPEEFVNLAHRLAEFVGLLFDREV